MKHPRVIVVSGPSGVGKSSVVARSLASDEDLSLSVSLTTRKPRPGEQDGVHYHFVEKEQFQEMVNQGGFLEWAQVYDNFYGTSREHVEQILAQGKHAILDVDTQGALAIQQGYQGAVLVFIAPPSLEDLESRLRGRGTEDEASLHKRLSKAEHEISFSGRYDFKIINDDLDKAVEAFFSILTQVGEQNVEFTKLDINPTETLAVTTEKAVQYALEKMGQEELVRSLKKEVKTALVLEIEELIRDRLAKAINNDLSDIVAETYRVYKTL